MHASRTMACAVIPVHDEAAAIAKVVREAKACVERVFIVDDGSRDGSASVATAAGATVLCWPRRRGKGTALRAGLELAFEVGFGAAVTLDGDGQHAASEIPRFLAALASGADLVLGDRSAGLDRMPFARRWTNATMTWMLRPFAGAWLRDSQCGFRLITARLFRSLSLRCEHFDFESEILIAARRIGASAVHVPVSVRYGRERSKIRAVPDALRFVRLLARAALPREERCLRESTPAEFRI